MKLLQLTLLQLALQETEGWPQVGQIGRVIWTSGDRFSMLTMKGNEIDLMITGCGVSLRIFSRPDAASPWIPAPYIETAYERWREIVDRELKHGYKKRGR